MSLDLPASFCLQAIMMAAAVGVFASAVLTLASVLNYSRTGPALEPSILAPFRGWMVYSLLRHACAAALIAGLLSLPGIACLTAVSALLGVGVGPGFMFIVGGISAGLIVAFRFASELVLRPSSLVASWAFDLKRLNRMWKLLSPTKLAVYRTLSAVAAGGLLLAGCVVQLQEQQLAQAGFGAAVFLAGAWCFGWRLVLRRAAPTRRASAQGQTNIVMIGADTLRADKLGVTGYGRNVSPHLNELVGQSWLFETCFVPLARTAPSLVSLMTGLWPFEHRVRDNFSTRGLVGQWQNTLASVLGDHGYHTAAISDWSGADFGKYKFGFEQLDVPADQWNLKYCIRQGQQHMRLFLSLFVDNAVGRHLLPEVFYQAGAPLAAHLVDRTRKSIEQLSETGAPFLLNVFMGVTHVPFGSEYPYYLHYSSPRYEGDSKFVMATFRDPNEVMEKQAWPKEWFDTDQINRLYDGCVRRFDDAVRDICQHLKDIGLWDNTILVIYSDHGLEFFENETWGQGNSIHGYDHGSRIPLIIRAPGRDAARVEQEVRSIDVMPTLLELAGIKHSGPMSGRSLVPLVNGTDSTPRPVYMETGVWMSTVRGMHPDHLRYPAITDLLTVNSLDDSTLCIKDEFADVIITAKDRALRYGRWKLEYIPTRSGVLYRLFDIVNDPSCCECVAERYPTELAQMRALLRDVLGDASAELIV